MHKYSQCTCHLKPFVARLGQSFSEVYQQYLPKAHVPSARNPNSNTILTSSSSSTANTSNDRMGTISSPDKPPISCSVTTVPNDALAKQMSPPISPGMPMASFPASPPGSAADKVTPTMASQKPVNPSPRKNAPRYSTQSTVPGFGLRKTGSHDGIRMPSALPAAASVASTGGMSQVAKVTVAQSDSTLATTRRRIANYASVQSMQSVASSAASTNGVQAVTNSHSISTSALTSTSSVVYSSSTSTNSSTTSLSPLSAPSLPPSVVTSGESTLSAAPAVLSAAKVAMASSGTPAVVLTSSALPFRSISPSSAVPVPFSQPLLPQMKFSENVQPDKPRDFQVPFGHQLAMSGRPMGYHHSAGDISLPMGGLTLDEATVLFPALLGTHTPSVPQPFLTQAASSGMYGPRHTMADLYSHTGTNNSTTQSPPIIPPTAGLPVAMDMTASGLRSSSLTSFNQNEEEEEVYSCYLCYREFDSAQEIAKHCQGVQHLEVVKKDSGGDKVWRWFPPPPDKSPDDFMMCSRLAEELMVVEECWDQNDSA